MDVLPLTWTLRHRYLHSGKLPGPPLQGLGRPLKVGKEEIAGLLTAVKTYIHLDHAAVRQEQIRRIEVVQEGLSNVPNIKEELMGSEGEGYPLLRILLDEKALGLTAFDFVNQLFEDDPAIAVGQEGVTQGYITVNPINLEWDQPSLLAERLRKALNR